MTCTRRGCPLLRKRIHSEVGVWRALESWFEATRAPPKAIGTLWRPGMRSPLLSGRGPNNGRGGAEGPQYRILETLAMVDPLQPRASSGAEKTQARGKRRRQCRGSGQRGGIGVQALDSFDVGGQLPFTIACSNAKELVWMCALAYRGTSPTTLCPNRNLLCVQSHPSVNPRLPPSAPPHKPLRGMPLPARARGLLRRVPPMQEAPLAATAAGLRTHVYRSKHELLVRQRRWAGE